MGRDLPGSFGRHGAAEGPLESGIRLSRESILRQLAQAARVAVLAALFLGLGILSVDGNQRAPLDALVPPTASPAVVQLAATSDVTLADVATRVPVVSDPVVSAPSPIAAATTLPAVSSPDLSTAAVERAADELAMSTNDLIRELRPDLSARGGRRAGEALLSIEQATAVPAREEISAAVGLAAAPKPAPTKAPTPRATPKPVPTKAPTPRPVATTAPTTSGALGQRVVSIALRYVGYRYTSGGTSPSTGFDCSGFVYFVYKTAGHPISRDIYVQYRTGIAVARSSLRAGDLVFFQNTYRYGLSHVSIYIGGGRIVHAQSESTGVTTSSLSESYWSSHYLGARRP